MSSGKHASKQEEDLLLQRPLYAFDLPPELLATLTIKGDGRSVETSQPFETTPLDNNDNDNNDSNASIAAAADRGDDKAGMSCSLCGFKSNTVQEQRQHVRSDIHKFNIKRKVRGKSAVSEIEFERIMEELSESISGSESSGSDDDLRGDPQQQQPVDQLTSMLRKKAALASNRKDGNREGDDDDDDDFRSGNKPQRSPLIWFGSPLLQKNTSIGVYRALFKGLEQDGESLDNLRKRQIVPTPANASSSGSAATAQLPKAPHVFMCMIGGGHFAAMVVSLAPKLMKRNGVMERDAVVLAHKTFHRYTTRRKQGGAQSANDASKGTAHSAGSSLRRYNEAALTAEIRELLGQWRKMVDEADLIFIRATGANNRKTLFSYEDAPLRSNDKRVRGFPFSTRRATQKELMRCFVELTRLKVSHVDEEALAALNAEAAAKGQASTAKSSAAPAKQKPSKEEEQAAVHTTALTALVRRSKGPAVVTYLSSNKLNGDFRLHPPNHHTPTLLHFAASSGQPNVVLLLLTKASPPSDPTIANSEGKTAFELSGDRITRDTFRLARTELGDKKWDWSAAKVSSGITKAQYDRNIEKDKNLAEASKKEEQERRDAELQRLKKMPDSATESGKNRKLGSAVAQPSAREVETRGLSEDAVRKLERERRARAAEARFKAMSNNN